MGDDEFVIESPRSKYVVHSSGVSKKVRVGSEYQADIPNYVRPRENGNKADVEVESLELELGLRIWTPITEVSEAKVQEFLQLATTEHSYSLEQAHGLLFWHKCNIEEARSDLTAYTPAPSQWNNEEREVFVQSLKVHQDKENNSQNILEIHKDLPQAQSAELSELESRDYLHETLRDFHGHVEPTSYQTEYAPTTISRFKKLNNLDSCGPRPLKTSFNKSPAAPETSTHVLSSAEEQGWC